MTLDQVIEELEKLRKAYGGDQTLYVRDWLHDGDVDRFYPSLEVRDDDGTCVLRIGKEKSGPSETPYRAP